MAGTTSRDLIKGLSLSLHQCRRVTGASWEMHAVVAPVSRCEIWSVKLPLSNARSWMLPAEGLSRWPQLVSLSALTIRYHLLGEQSVVGHHPPAPPAAPIDGQSIPPAPLGDGSGEVPGGDLGARNTRSSWRQLGGVWGGSPACNRWKQTPKPRNECERSGAESYGRA